MKRLLLAALAVACAPGCRKSPVPGKDPAPAVAVVTGEKLVDFDERHGEFRCRVPAEWKALEEHGTGGPLLMIYGTASGSLRGKVDIAVTRYGSNLDRVKTPQDYWEAMNASGREPSPLETRTAGGRIVYATHLLTPRYPPHGWKVLAMDREDIVLIPATKGFFALSHSAPADVYRTTLPVFDALVQSFRAKE